MVGDQPRDLRAGKTVGCITVFVASDLANERLTQADYTCVDIVAAARLIAQLERSNLAIH
jgi:phosphoglycolate phosphatase-like HAD superfamily hydrolase